MKYQVYRWLLTLEAIALILLAVMKLPWLWLIIAGVLLIVTVAMFYRSVVLPLRAVENGLSLLREQDFSSRLRHPGQRDADNVADLFNGLMAALKEERLKKQEQNRFLTQVMEVSPAGIAVTDFDGHIVEVNPAFRTLDSHTIREELATLKAGEKRVVRTEGTMILRLQKLSFMDSGHRHYFYLLEPMTEEIVRAERDVITRIIRTIGHEVNNSLGSVVSVLETLGQLNSGEPEVEAAVEGSVRSCRNLVRFVGGYSDLVKLPEPNMEPTDLAGFLKDILPSLKALLPQGCRLETELQEGIFVSVDPMLMERVMVNVVKNAAESIGDAADGRIIIRLTADRLDIIDNGGGIPPETASRIFTPFFSTKRPDRGLGLMLVTDILNRHALPFSLTSDSEQHLTTFRIILHP